MREERNGRKHFSLDKIESRGLGENATDRQRNRDKKTLKCDTQTKKQIENDANMRQTGKETERKNANRLRRKTNRLTLRKRK